MGTKIPFILCSDPKQQKSRTIYSSGRNMCVFSCVQKRIPGLTLAAYILWRRGRSWYETKYIPPSTFVPRCKHESRTHSQNSRRFGSEQSIESHLSYIIFKLQWFTFLICVILCCYKKGRPLFAPWGRKVVVKAPLFLSLKSQTHDDVTVPMPVLFASVASQFSPKVSEQEVGLFSAFPHYHTLVSSTPKLGLRIYSFGNAVRLYDSIQSMLNYKSFFLKKYFRRKRLGAQGTIPSIHFFCETFSYILNFFLFCYCLLS